MIVAGTLASCLACFLIGLLGRPRSRRSVRGDASTRRQPASTNPANELTEAAELVALLRQDILNLPSLVFAPTATGRGARPS